MHKSDHNYFCSWAFPFSTTKGWVTLTSEGQHGKAKFFLVIFATQCEISNSPQLILFPRDVEFAIQPKPSLSDSGHRQEIDI